MGFRFLHAGVGLQGPIEIRERGLCFLLSLLRGPSQRLCPGVAAGRRAGVVERSLVQRALFGQTSVRFGERRMLGSDFDAGGECGGMAVARGLAFLFGRLAALDGVVQGLPSLGSAGIGDPGTLFGGARAGLRLGTVPLGGIDRAGQLVEPVLLLEPAGHRSRFARGMCVPIPPPERAGAVNQPLTGN